MKTVTGNFLTSTMTNNPFLVISYCTKSKWLFSALKHLMHIIYSFTHYLPIYLSTYIYIYILQNTKFPRVFIYSVHSVWCRFAIYKNAVLLSFLLATGGADVNFRFSGGR